MSTKADHEKQKLIQDKCQIILGNLLREEDNKYCVDCDAKGPRWASWNLGIFLCIRCAGIHRNLGVHISKVKSVNLDTWNPDQVGHLQQMGNSQARAVYEANLPENFRRPQSDSALEAFIRAKYEQKKYIAKEWVRPPTPKPAFDIEEEKKKEREQKKRKNLKSLSAGPTHDLHPLNQPLPVPTAVPRPHSTGHISPSPRSTGQQEPNVPNGPGGEDLLNLDAHTGSGDDIFDAFLSADLGPTCESTMTPPQASLEASASQSNRSADEADFFNQRSENVAQSNKLTKETILSLYATNPSQTQATQHICPVYGMQAGVYLSQQPFAQVSIPTFQTIPTSGITSAPGSNITGMYNPFASFGQPVQQDGRQQPNVWLPPGSGGDDSLIMTHNLGQVNQQMMNLQLSGQAWNVANATTTTSPTINSGNLVFAPNQPRNSGIMWPTPPNSQNQNFQNNVWK